MPFGRYEGVLLADLPGAYLGWFARVGFPEGQIGHLLAVMFEISHNGLRDLLTPLRTEASTGGGADGDRPPDRHPDRGAIPTRNAAGHVPPAW
jgi:uncharacterized protein (DUF3820 family)